MGLAQFGLANLPEGEPLSQLEAKFLPLYLHHRYQLTAAAKSLGGVYYTYAVREAAGANPPRVVEVVPAARQREALAAVLSAISVEELRVPPRVLALLPPRAFGYDFGTAELFEKRTAPVFDAVGAATIAADLVLTELLQPNRAARLVQQHAQDAAVPRFEDVVGSLIKATWGAPVPRDEYGAEVARAVQSLTVTRLMELAANPNAAPRVRAVATTELRWLHGNIAALKSAHPHHLATLDDIERFLARPDEPRRKTPPLPRPPGDPIGSAQPAP